MNRKIENYEEVFETIVGNIISFYKKNPYLEVAVLGLSGGLDSTVVAGLMYEATRRAEFPIGFICRSLPIKNKKNEISGADLAGKAFCHWSYQEVPLKKVYNQFTRHIKPFEFDKGKPQTPIANGNIQARLRMTYLYNLAGIHNGIVLDTDNLTEHYLGFFTLHGDVGDFKPIGGLWKHEVYELAKYMVEYFKDNTDAQNALKAAIDITPTDGLGISKSDLEQIGGKDYYEVDEILIKLLTIRYIPNTPEFEAEIDKIKENYDSETVDKIYNRIVKSEFKRYPPTAAWLQREFIFPTPTCKGDC